MPKKKYEVIVKTSVEDAPEIHEMSAALILAYHFKTDVVFLRVQHGRTPDVDIDGIKWEIKSPLGDGKRTIDNNFSEARGQSKNIVIDLRRTKMHQAKANARIRYYLSTPHNFKQVLVITKNKKVVVIL
ncbi:MAG TPA: hypothetical protein PKE10_03830 [Candidatus Saccharibacteria bacterium]|nr:hypothetical protein [Candidatus Saccharibacteria bacterium]